MPPEGLALPHNSSRKAAFSKSGVTKSVTLENEGGNTVQIAFVADPDLATVMSAWAQLPPSLRAGITVMVRSAVGDRVKGDRTPKVKEGLS